MSSDFNFNLEDLLPAAGSTFGQNYMVEETDYRQL